MRSVYLKDREFLSSEEEKKKLEEYEKLRYTARTEASKDLVIALDAIFDLLEGHDICIYGTFDSGDHFKDEIYHDDESAEEDFMMDLCLLAAADGMFFVIDQNEKKIYGFYAEEDALYAVPKRIAERHIQDFADDYPDYECENVTIRKPVNHIFS